MEALVRLKNIVTQQRDSALSQRDSARSQRDSARHERDDLKDNEINRQQFVATLSHDLRNPIGVIKSAIDVLRGEQTVQQFEAMIDMIDRNADIAEELIRHLLDATLIEAGGKLPINSSWCDILSILEECKESYSPVNRNRIIIDDLKDKDFLGFWDPHTLKRAFNNLLSNALKFSESIHEVRIFAKKDFSVTEINVQNFGKIISPEDQAKIFKSYYKVEDNKTQGWGLGLTLVKGVAEAHGGSVCVSSNENDGTIFTIKLPNNL